MRFKEGTTVYTADGQTVGDIERFVLDPRAREIRGLVVRKGFLFTEDKVIPVSAVAEARDDRVSLHASADADDFPPFEEHHYITPDESEVRDLYKQQFNAPVYYYPPYGGASWFTHAATQFSTEKVKERNIPEGTVPLKEGARVFSRDGEHVGDVKEVLTNSSTHKITHLRITKGLLLKEEKLVPAHWIDIVTEKEVHLAVSSNLLEKLVHIESYQI